MGHKSKYELDDQEYDAKKKYNSSRKRDARKEKAERLEAYDKLVPTNTYKPRSFR